ncbi:DNA gyrase inhibitor YacG [Aromatoleum sp.]|uniref:DNA gyrase inhibitor YacG n=1 Tax=Aromatoleum sp. TaxID=2307007 RepID=UPI002FC6C316
MTKIRTVNCPQCGAKVKWTPESRFRPFCSERCKQIDLGAWAAEDYRVPDGGRPDDLSTDNRHDD